MSVAAFGDEVLISAHDISKQYDGFRLDGVSLEVHEGEVVGFIGQNGAGKSTTIKAILGLITLDGGKATLLGCNSSTLSKNNAQVKEEVGVVFDTVSVPGHLKVSDVGRVCSRAYSNWNAQRFAEFTKLFDLDESKAVKELSRGMGMKLSLACALSHQTRVLVLDEATAGLDPMARDEILDLLLEYVAQDDHGVLLSSHITSDLERIADRVVCIDKGRILFDMEKDAITDEMGIAHCRLADFERVLAAQNEGEQVRYLRRDYGIDLCVPHRYDFLQRYPEIPCDRMTIDEYMTFILKGGVRQ